MPQPLSEQTTPTDDPPQRPTFQEVQRAAEILKGVAHRTPVVSSRLLNELVSERAGCEVEVYFKCENLQRVGAFKFRGGFYATSQLSDEVASRGVCTHSSGNHAQAVALAARERGVPAYIVMPSTAPVVKRAAVEGYGAEVITCEPTLKAREASTAALQAKTGAHLIHPYNDPHVIAGQGTATLELIEELRERGLSLDVFVAPIGGGGLMSGACLTLSALSPHTQRWGAEPSGANDAALSLASGQLVPQTNPQTICDGLHAGLGSLNWAILREHLTRVVTPNDQEVIEAMRLIWSRLKLIVEPSAAIGLAALLCSSPPALKGSQLKGSQLNDSQLNDRQLSASRPLRVGVVLSGGNVDLDRLPWGRQPS